MSNARELAELASSDVLTVDSGNVVVGGTTAGSSGAVTLYNNGKIDYEFTIIDGGGLNVRSTNTFNDNNNNFVGSLTYGLSVLVIRQGNGIGPTILPFFQNAGGGVAWSGSLFDPDSGSFVYGNGPSITFTAAGTSGNTYTVTMIGGTGHCYIQRTSGSYSYTASICALLS